MFVVANFLEALGTLLGVALNIYMWIVIARALVSWVNPDPYNPIVRFLYSATEPVLYRVRRMVPVYAGGIDFSPIIVFAAIYFLQLFLVQSIYDVARSLRFMGMR